MAHASDVSLDGGQGGGWPLGQRCGLAYAEWTPGGVRPRLPPQHPQNRAGLLRRAAEGRGLGVGVGLRGAAPWELSWELSEAPWW